MRLFGLCCHCVGGCGSCCGHVGIGGGGCELVVRVVVGVATCVISTK